jgi:glycosyltransferase involved in cell wall biosynthesis
MSRRPESSPDAPRVSVGLPVFNGENFVAQAIQSVLAQTCTDLELIIQDNASTDRTADICRDLAASDRRVRYFRNPRNLGAAPNYNLTYSVARGRYFKWLAHDDYIEPAFLAETSRVLEERPEAVMCNTVVRYVWADGTEIGLYDSGLAHADHASPAARFAAMVLPSHSCVDFFGLLRRDALKHSLLHGSFHGADRAFLAQMALRGPLVQLPEPLVVMREHGQRYTRQKASPAQSLAWHDATRHNAMVFPTWRLYAEYLKMVQHESLGAAERMRCYGVLAQWWARNWNSARAAVDLLGIVAPGAQTAAWRVKTRLFGAAPGHFVADRRR